MTTLRNLSLTLVLSQSLMSGAKIVKSPQELTLHQNVVVDTISSATLTITKVKKPWYAWRNLVVGKMEKSIPEYKAIKGLNQKLYSFTEDHKQFGGVYLWKTEKDAKTWFNQAWYDITEKKYGKKGIVDFYTVQVINSFAEFPLQNGNYWCVLTQSDIDLEIQKTTIGIVQKTSLKDSTGTLFYLTVWLNKASANNFFKGKNLKNEFFDSPIAFNNNK
jgi:hypothetical protein